MKKTTKSQGAGCVIALIIWAIGYFVVRAIAESDISNESLRGLLIFGVGILFFLFGASLVAQKDSNE